jgi:FkbM family methyltransferase
MVWKWSRYKRFILRWVANIMNEFQRWFADNGDKTHRLNYDLNSDSVVFDVGGYKGDFAFNIYEKFKCKVYIFEPVESFYNSIVERFSNNDNIFVFKYGLSGADSCEDISIIGDASSLYKQGHKTEKIQIRETAKVIEELNIDKIDLIKINIEGGEYPLLFHCIGKKLVNKMRDIQVQFHSFADYAPPKRDLIQQYLQKTHYITYDYPFVWENWKLKEDIDD